MSKSLTMSQLCKHYDCCRATIYNWMNTKGFPKGNIGPKGRRWSVASIERFDRRFDSTKDVSYARQ